MKMIFHFGLLCCLGISWPCMADQCLNYLNTLFGPSRPKVQTSFFKQLEIQELKSLAMELEFNDNEWKAFKKSLDQLNERVSPQTLESYLHYAKSLKSSQRVQALEDLRYLSDEKISSDSILKFRKLKVKLEKKSSRIYHNKYKQLLNSHPEAAKDDLQKQAMKETRSYMRRYERVYMGCRSKTMTPERKAAEKTFRNFSIAIGSISSISTYTFYNYDKEKDWEWFGKIAYEVILANASGYIGSSIVSNPATSVWVKGAQRYFLGRATGLSDLFLYQKMFGTNQEEAKARLDQILSDPQAKQKLAELNQYLHHPSLVEKLKQQLVKNLSVFEGRVGLSGKVADNNLRLENLSEKDLQDPEVQDVLLAAVMAQIYAQDSGELIQTGHQGADRYLYNALYALPSLPKDTLVAMAIYNTLCMSPLNPKQALLKAVGIYTLNRLLFDQIYFYLRRKSINQ